MVELAGNSCAGGGFWNLGLGMGAGGRGTGPTCTYSARCDWTKRELEEKIRAGERIDPEEIARQEKSRKKGRRDGHIV